LATGAVACIESPHGRNHRDSDASAAQLLLAVKLMSEIKVVHRWPRGRRGAAGGPNIPAAPATPTTTTIDFIGIGASTGGPSVLKTILEGLPRDFPVPLLVVQHICRGFLNGLSDWLNQATGAEVHVAAHGISPLCGHVYLAPDNLHMGVAIDGTIILTGDEQNQGVCPSVSRLFQSLAGVCGPNAVGVLLTGMGKDGAEALKRMRECGATTIAQDRASSAIHGMPGEAIAIGAASCILSASQIAPALVALAHQRNHCEGTML
jgi:two-component system chemotaxis response regulator CheB